MASEQTQLIFELPAVLDLKAAPPLAERLRALRGAALTLDAGRVEWLGGQCLQVLLAAAQSWRADGAALRLAGVTAEFCDGLKRLGVTPAELSGAEMEMEMEP
ncbi:STAS domain-containing protein [Mesorhizobium sp. KR1-2]|uniref:STAS domain-containing protein n=1 Tax=Mesorhizobium sp. KR1-2 TaxID=3156609 RepID=UPI0032B48B16